MRLANQREKDGDGLHKDEVEEIRYDLEEQRVLFALLGEGGKYGGIRERQHDGHTTHAETEQARDNVDCRLRPRRPIVGGLCPEWPTDERDHKADIEIGRAEQGSPPTIEPPISR